MRNPASHAVGATTLFLLLTIPSTAAALSTFEMDRTSSDPVNGTGSLSTSQTTHSHQIRLQSDSSAQVPPLLMGTQVEFTITETRDPTANKFKTLPIAGVPGPARIRRDPTAGVFDHSSQIKFISNDTRLYVIDAAPLSRWDLASRSAGNSSAILVGACQMTPTGHQIANPILPNATMGLVQARCEAQSVAAQGAMSGHFLGSVFRIIDDERDIIVRTGAHAEPDPWLPGIEHVVWRTLSYRTLTHDFAFQYESPTNITTTTPLLTWTGHLHVPPADVGELRWRPWYLNGSLPAIEPEGAFHVRSAGKQHLDIRGTTFNAPAPPPPASLATPEFANAGILLLAALPILVRFPFRRLAAPVTALFTRITQSDALLHPRRREILEFVRQNPACSVQDVVRHFGFDYRTGLHHAKVLCQQGLLVCRHIGTATALFVKGEVSWDEMPILAHARRPSVRRVIAALRNHARSQSEIASHLGTTQQNVSKLLRQLLQDRLISVRRDGKRLLYEAEEQALRAVPH